MKAKDYYLGEPTKNPRKSAKLRTTVFKQFDELRAAIIFGTGLAVGYEFIVWLIADNYCDILGNFMGH